MPFNRTISQIVLTFAAIFALPTLAAAATYSVSNSSELQSALSSAGAGDEIVLQDGTYSGFSTRRGGSNGNPLTIRAANRHKAIVQWPHSGHQFGTNVDIRHSNIILRGIKVDGRNLSWDNLTLHGGGGSLIQNILIEDNWIVNCKGLIISEAGTDNIGLRGPTIIDNIKDREPTLFDNQPTLGDNRLITSVSTHID